MVLQQLMKMECRTSVAVERRDSAIVAAVYIETAQLLQRRGRYATCADSKCLLEANQVRPVRKPDFVPKNSTCSLREDDGIRLAIVCEGPILPHGEAPDEEKREIRRTIRCGLNRILRRPKK